MSWRSNYFTAIVVLNGKIFVKYHRIKKSNQSRFEEFLKAKYPDPVLVVNYYELRDRTFAESVKLR